MILKSRSTEPKQKMSKTEKFRNSERFPWKVCSFLLTGNSGWQKSHGENERGNLFEQNSNEYSTVRDRNGVVVAEDRERERAK